MQQCKAIYKRTPSLISSPNAKCKKITVIYQMCPSCGLQHILLFLIKMTRSHITPCYKKSILGAKWTISGINFFCRFLLRLSENNHSRVMFMAKFGPTASNFGYEILIFGSRLEPSCDHTFEAGLDLTSSPFRGLNFDEDFPNLLSIFKRA